MKLLNYAIAVLSIVLTSTPAMAQAQLIGPTCWCQVDVSFLVDGTFTHGTAGFVSPNPYYGGVAPDGTTGCGGSPVTITVDGQSVGDPPASSYAAPSDGCGPGVGGGSVCPIFPPDGPPLANGGHSVVIGCLGPATCDSSGLNCTRQPQKIEIPITVADKTLSMSVTNAPVNGSTIAPQAVTFSGTLSDVVPGATAYVNGIAASMTGSSWTVTLDSMTLSMISFSTTGASDVTIGMYAKDPNGNFVGYSTAPGSGVPDTQYTAIDPTLIRNFVVDGVPPVVTFDQGSAGGSTAPATVSIISGIVTD